MKIFRVRFFFLFRPVHFRFLYFKQPIKKFNNRLNLVSRWRNFFFLKKILSFSVVEKVFLIMDDFGREKKHCAKQKNNNNNRKEEAKINTSAAFCHYTWEQLVTTCCHQSDSWNVISSSVFLCLQLSMESSTDAAAARTFSQVLFTDIPHSYPPSTPVTCCYTLTDAFQPNPRDWVGIFKVR